MKPIVDLINERYFISFEKKEDHYSLHLFELVKGGVSLKLTIENYSERRVKELEKRDKDYDLYADDFSRDEKRTF